MSKRKMASKTRYSIIVYNDDAISFADITELFRLVLGFETTQAHQCAILIHNRGSYKIKTYKNIEDADATYEYLTQSGITAEIRKDKY